MTKEEGHNLACQRKNQNGKKSHENHSFIHQPRKKKWERLEELEQKLKQAPKRKWGDHAVVERTTRGRSESGELRLRGIVKEICFGLRVLESL